MIPVLQNSPNRSTLVSAAHVLKPMLQDIVFVGGQVTELLITDPAAVRLRVTYDVDVLVTAATKGAYDALSERLRSMGLRNDMSEGAPVCRWIAGSGLLIDVMPIDAGILGFSNRWYPYVMESAMKIDVRDDLAIRIASAPAFLASKWEAFRNRGKGDFIGSYDVEDIIMLVAGRPALMNELQAAPVSVRQFTGRQCQDFLAHDVFAYAIEGVIPDAALIPGIVNDVAARFAALASVA
jgi:hypothetical protein